MQLASTPAAPTPFHRCVAAMSVALVLLLTAAATSPTLHEHLHADGGKPVAVDHSCAVVLFAGGVTLALAAVWLMATPAVWREFAPAAVDAVLPRAPRYLRQPERGPPSS